ncbi:DNA-binding protein [Streptomyces olivaceus]|uniref:DNA-binding protein n=1 Tax=Streptomyces olivaceus TaxID=47716 RepID=UPI001CCCA983|nr:DNA-binding protein [Streptomyces olivaceus]MBZ6252177.1 DNA-binding protein [Streptomyces olivaceus]
MKTIERTQSGGPTLDEIRAWPATVPVARAATALGCSRAHMYEMIKAGRAPVRTLQLGVGRTVVLTASLVRVLSGEAA